MLRQCLRFLSLDFKKRVTKGEEFAKVSSDGTVTALAPGNLAISFIENKNYNKALISLERISGLNLNPYNRSRVYASYGHIYLKLFKYEESETYYLKSIDNSKYIQNGVYEGLAQISIVKRDYIQALSYIDKRIASSELKNESISSYIVAYSYLFESNQKKIFDKICEYAKLMQSEEKIELNYSKDKQKKLRAGAAFFAEKLNSEEEKLLANREKSFKAA